MPQSCVRLSPRTLKMARVCKHGLLTSMRTRHTVSSGPLCESDSAVRQPRGACQTVRRPAGGHATTGSCARQGIGG